MLEELNKYHSVGTEKSINCLLGVLMKSNSITLKDAKQIYLFSNQTSNYFTPSILLFEYLGIIRVGNEQILITSEGETVKSLKKTYDRNSKLCRLCFEKMINDNVIEMNNVHFDRNKVLYIIPRNCFPLKAALFRNFLLQLQAIAENANGDYSISREYEELLIRENKKNHRKKSIEKLKKELKKKEIQGELAELFVLKFEQMRVNQEKRKDIKRISILDVSAGYDIVSFNNDKSIEFDRFIEVKSYYGNPHFYWSKNEIEVAKLLGDKYCIYLVNISNINDPSYKPLIINNPYENIFIAETWIKSPTTYLFQKI